MHSSRGHVFSQLSLPSHRDEFLRRQCRARRVQRVACNDDTQLVGTPIYGPAESTLFKEPSRNTILQRRHRWPNVRSGTELSLLHCQPPTRLSQILERVFRARGVERSCACLAESRKSQNDSLQRGGLDQMPDKLPVRRHIHIHNHLRGRLRLLHPRPSLVRPRNIPHPTRQQRRNTTCPQRNNRPPPPPPPIRNLHDPILPRLSHPHRPPRKQHSRRLPGLSPLRPRHKLHGLLHHSALLFRQRNRVPSRLRPAPVPRLELPQHLPMEHRHRPKHPAVARKQQCKLRYRQARRPDLGARRTARVYFGQRV